jgi:hypothetical protein
MKIDKDNIKDKDEKEDKKTLITDNKIRKEIGKKIIKIIKKEEFLEDKNR